MVVVGVVREITVICNAALCGKQSRGEPVYAVEAMKSLVPQECTAQYIEAWQE